jgi:hypothetical protein
LLVGQEATTLATCLFTGVELDDETHVEHTIPRSMGGRIRSKIVSCDAFNSRCGDLLDQELKAAYDPIYNHLGPLLSREHQPGDIDVASQAGVGRYKLKPGGKLESQGWWATSRDEKGRPTAIEGDEYAVKKEARRLGVPEEKYERVRQPKEPTQIQIPGMYTKELELGMLKAGLLTFDHLLADNERRFTRDYSLSAVRSLIRAAIMEGVPADKLHLENVWGIDFQLLADLREFRERFIGEAKTPFEHVLIASGNSAPGTVDLVWSVFSFEPHRFRLTWSWAGPDFTFLAVNGVLKGSTAPLEAITVSTPFRMGPRSAMRARVPEPEFSPDRQREFGEELADRRTEAYRHAVDLVERRADSFVVEALVDEARFLIEPSSASPKMSVFSCFVGRLESLFLDRNKMPANRSVFDQVLHEVKCGLSKERAADEVSEDEEGLSLVDWDYWLSVHRNALDRLKPSLGHPGVQEKTEVVVDYRRV